MLPACCTKSYSSAWLRPFAASSRKKACRAELNSGSQAAPCGCRATANTALACNKCRSRKKILQVRPETSRRMDVQASAQKVEGGKLSLGCQVHAGKAGFQPKQRWQPLHLPPGCAAHRKPAYTARNTFVGCGGGGGDGGPGVKANAHACRPSGLLRDAARQQERLQPRRLHCTQLAGSCKPGEQGKRPGGPSENVTCCCQWHHPCPHFTPPPSLPEQAGAQLPQKRCRVAQRLLHVVIVLRASRYCARRAVGIGRCRQQTGRPRAGPTM